MKKGPLRRSRRVAKRASTSAKKKRNSDLGLQTITDVIEGVKAGKSQTEIEKKTGIPKRSVLDVITLAFKKGMLSLNPANETAHIKQFTERAFPGVKFFISPAKYEFSRDAARQLLCWIRDAYKTVPQDACQSRLTLPYLAIGGGETIFGICQEMKSVLATPECSELRDSLRSNHFCITNATAGGQTWEPRCEASKLACEMGNSLNKDVGIYSVSRSPSKNEKDLIHAAVNNTFMVVSGVGTPQDAQCIKALVESERIKQEDLENVAGEFLYHPYSVVGQPIFDGTTDWFDIKESLVHSENIPTQQNSSPFLASLFDFSSLKRTPPKGRFRIGRSLNVVAVVRCSDANRTAKASSLFHLLMNNFLTHVCIPFDLALELKEVADKKA
jgi:hypothetical protein